MTDQDIVTRLRGHIAITTRLHFAKDGFAEPVYVHGPSPICQEAADEIERLRNTRDALEAERDELIRIANKLTRERDEARREVCNNEANHLPTMADPRREAKRRGWDCFKEDKEDTDD